MAELFDFAVITIFAREFLEGSIILGEYRTIIQRGGQDMLEDGVTQARALRAINMAAWVAIATALVMIAAIAIPLWALSRNFDDSTSKIIEGISKMVAGVCLLQLSLKLPKFLGVYGSTKHAKASPKGTRVCKHKDTDGTAVSRSPSSDVAENEGDAKTQAGNTQVTLSTVENPEDASRQSQLPSELKAPADESIREEIGTKLSLRNMRFNVAWNIWREGTYIEYNSISLFPLGLLGSSKRLACSSDFYSRVTPDRVVRQSPSAAFS
jgi:hypothetical protein